MASHPDLVLPPDIQESEDELSYLPDAVADELGTSTPWDLRWSMSPQPIGVSEIDVIELPSDPEDQDGCQGSRRFAGKTQLGQQTACQNKHPKGPHQVPSHLFAL